MPEKDCPLYHCINPLYTKMRSLGYCTLSDNLKICKQPERFETCHHYSNTVAETSEKILIIEKTPLRSIDDKL